MTRTLSPELSEQYLTREELAARYGISVRTLDDWVAQGKAPPATLLPGRLKVFRREAVKVWERQQEQRPKKRGAGQARNG